ncbi:Fasciclin-like arabinogalactan protein 6 [Cardamine amara subsp. amara]|uniref:Fasciclin-like arabinogalactan protein 6 n=1 Tax=Cardamine amara subsp. amara TaxID=228776 RepID=A0ABD1BQ90_CARAN
MKEVFLGVVETRIDNALTQKFPLAVYVVDKVLLPEELFGTKTTPTGAPALKSIPASDADSPTADNGHKSAGTSVIVKRTSLGFVLGFAWFVVGVFLEA